MHTWIHDVGLAAAALTAAALVSFVLRVTALALFGRLALAAARDASAAVRHAIATATLAALLLLPLAAALVPAWRLPVLPSLPSGLAPAAAAFASRIAPAAADPLLRRAYGAVDGEMPTPPASATVRREARPVTPAADLTPRPVVLEPVGEERSVAVPEPAAPVRSPFPWALALAVIVIGVSELMLLRCVASALFASWCARGGDDVSEPAVLALFEQARRRAGVTTGVALRVSPRVSVPVVAGVVHPVLLLPPAAARWTAERLEVVFLHELAHVARRDAVALLVARAACALYWFHPLVRGLAADARRDCEQACDDRVLGWGVRPSSYADHLLRIARGGAPRDVFGGTVLAVARRTNLERRLRAILRDGGPRGAVGRRATAAVAVLALALLVPLATVHVTQAAARPQARHATAAPRAWVPQAATPAAPEAVVSPVTPSTAALDLDVTLDAAAPNPVPAGAFETVPALAPTPAVAPIAELASNRYRNRGDWYSRAKDAYDDERWAEAASAYENAARAGYRPETAWYNAACSWALAGDGERALAALDASVDAGWDDADMLRRDDDLASIRRDSRFRALVERIRSTPEGESERRSAAAEFEALRASGSRDADDWGSAGLSLMRAGDTEHAVQAYKRALDLEPSSTYWYNLGCAHALGGHRDEALAALEQSVGAGYSDGDHMRKDDDLESLHGSARFARIASLADDLELNPDGIDDDDSRGWRRELPRLEGVARAHPNVGAAWFNLGYGRLKAHDIAGSREAYEKCLELGHRKATTEYNLACVAAQERDVDETLRWLDRAEADGFELEGRVIWDSDFDPVRSDSRFRALQHRLQDRNIDKGHDALKRALKKLDKSLGKL